MQNSSFFSRFFHISVLFSAALLVSCVYVEIPKTIQSPFWSVSPQNPVILFGHTLTNIFWNDPTVLYEDGIYKMWLSGGTGIGLNPVNIYYATSSDGFQWTINPAPVLTVGTSGQWDDNKAETPSVIRVGGIYHIYYSGGQYAETSAGRYHIGHAVSTNGLNWTKDPANPVITYNLVDPTHYGFYTTAEPGVCYFNGNYFLFYTTAKSRPGYSGDLAKYQSICLSVSANGSAFTPYDPDQDGFLDAVLEQSDYYPVSLNYIGYSTPSALVTSDGKMHLFYDVVTDPDTDIWRQVALAHAVSDNGTNFTETERDIIIRGSDDWLESEVRSPNVVEAAGLLKMWFAGHSDSLTNSGIGFASFQ